MRTKSTEQSKDERRMWEDIYALQRKLSTNPHTMTFMNKKNEVKLTFGLTYGKKGTAHDMEEYAWKQSVLFK